MIYVGIDDTDVKGSLGTKQLARLIIRDLYPDYEGLLAVRHQLLFDPRVPYTSKNSAAALLFAHPSGRSSIGDLAARIRRFILEHYVEGCDPGLCVTAGVPDEVTQFGRRCQVEVVAQAAARDLAGRHGIHLESLGGTGDGVIGALAAVGLVRDGNDGRIVRIAQWDDDISGPQEASLLMARGVDDIRCLASGQPLTAGLIDIGKKLRPNYRAGRVVLFVEPAAGDSPAKWQAVRCL